MIYKCSDCGVELRPQTDLGDAVSHGLCKVCLAALRLAVAKLPTCGMVGHWGECNLFVNHVGPCKRLPEDISYRMRDAVGGPACQRAGGL